MDKQKKQTILIVDDDPSNLLLLQNMLEHFEIDIITASCGKEAVDKIQYYDFSLILLDIVMPELDGFDTARALKKAEKNQHIPIIFITAIPETQQDIEKGYNAGGIDFLFKPVKKTILEAKVKFFLELADRQNQLAHATATIQEQNLMLEQKAIRDGLTGLFNHNFILEQLAKEISLARRFDSHLSLLLMDLDFFKDTNDTCGHSFGDYVLSEFSRRISNLTDDNGILGRYGGEEFIVILPEHDADSAFLLAETMRKAIANEPFDNGHYSRYITVSTGVYSDSAKNVANSGTIIDFADHALYQAKAEGRNKVLNFIPPQNNLLELDTHLRDIIGTTQQNQLTATVEKARAITLASFEAMVHSQSREYKVLLRRNKTSIKVLNTLGQKLNLPDRLLCSFRRASKLHDLFRCYIRDSTWETTGPLNSDQKEMLFEQPLMLHELTSLFDFFADERTILSSHHEHFDGNGYPDGLKDNEIPIAARIFSLVDAFVAMVSPVSSKNSLTKDEVLEELKNGSAKQFDPFLVTMFIELIDELNIFNEEGVVTHNVDSRHQKPVKKK